MTQTFSLSPFQDENYQSDHWSHLNITVEVQRSYRFLDLNYQLQGNTSNLVWPEPTAKPSRQDNLWESTCFEYFLSPRNATHYYEVNLAPNSNWNMYHFQSYRTGMREASEITDLTYQTKIDEAGATLNCRLPLSPLAMVDTQLDLGVTAVLASRLGTISYWATKHSANQPDFHQRESFTIKV